MSKKQEEHGQPTSVCFAQLVQPGTSQPDCVLDSWSGWFQFTSLDQLSKTQAGWFQPRRANQPGPAVQNTGWLAGSSLDQLSKTQAYEKVSRFSYYMLPIRQTYMWTYRSM